MNVDALPLPLLLIMQEEVGQEQDTGSVQFALRGIREMFNDSAEYVFVEIILLPWSAISAQFVYILIWTEDCSGPSRIKATAGLAFLISLPATTLILIKRCPLRKALRSSAPLFATKPPQLGCNCQGQMGSQGQDQKNNKKKKQRKGMSRN